MNPLRLAQGGPGQPSQGTPGEQRGARYWLWEGKDRQSGPYTHDELLLLLELRAATRKPAPKPKQSGREERRQAIAKKVRPSHVVSVTRRQLDVLYTLDGCVLSVRQIAEDLGLTYEKVREHLRDMAARGLVMRTSDKYPAWAVTPRGREVLDQFFPRGAK